MNEFWIEAARLHTKPNDINFPKGPIPRSELERFVRLKMRFLAAAWIRGTADPKWDQQWEACRSWLERYLTNFPELVKAEQEAVLQKFPDLETETVRKVIAKRFRMDSVKFKATEHERNVPIEDLESFTELKLKAMAANFLNNGCASKEELQDWKAKWKACQETLERMPTELMKLEYERASKVHPELLEKEARDKIYREHDASVDKLKIIEGEGQKIGDHELKAFLRLTLKGLDARALEPEFAGLEAFRKRQKVRKTCSLELEGLKFGKNKLKKWSNFGLWMLFSFFEV